MLATSGVTDPNSMGCFSKQPGADFRVAAIQELTAWFVPRPLCYASVRKTRARSPHKRVPLPSIAET
jgi:hypothetical protein